MDFMLRWHRAIAVIAALLAIWIIGFGVATQAIDLAAITTHAPATDRNMLMMRQHITGPQNYAVVSVPDYTASPLPASLDMPAALQRAAALGRAAAPGEPLRLVELRNVNGAVAGHVQMGERHMMFDLATGAPMADKLLPPARPGEAVYAPRTQMKNLHRFLFLPWGPTINLVESLLLSGLIVTGLIQYRRLYQARARMKRDGLLWQGGDSWRKLHRWTALCSCVLVIWITLGGLALSLDQFGANIHQLGKPRSPTALNGDMSSPMSDAQLAPMANQTLAAYRAAAPDTAIKVLRLRTFANYPQGVVVGADADTTQWVFNGQTGKQMKMWEPGYPDLSFPTGWEIHQKLKQFHRGDLFGLPGRWLILLGGLAMFYLSISGSVMWLQQYRKRRASGRSGLFWK
jgi:uncharacterized iron-regulated membrane protein